MIWLEMSREEKHGGGEWSFQKCIWAPSHKKEQITNGYFGKIF